MLWGLGLRYENWIRLWGPGVVIWGLGFYYKDWGWVVFWLGSRNEDWNCATWLWLHYKDRGYTLSWIKAEIIVITFLRFSRAIRFFIFSCGRLLSRCCSTQPVSYKDCHDPGPPVLHKDFHKAGHSLVRTVISQVLSLKKTGDLCYES